jgi:hypothetical protein
MSKKRIARFEQVINNRNIRRNIMKKQAKNSTIKKLKWVTLIALLLASFTFFACDGSDDDGGTNTAPGATDGSLTVDEDTPATGTLSASDADGDALTYSIVTNGTLGTASITDQTTGAYTYTPNQDANGSDSFTFKVNDGTQDSNVATIMVTITVTANNPPVADAGDDQTVDEVTVVGLSGSGNDVEDGTSVTFSWSPPAGSGVVLDDTSSPTPSFTAPAVTQDTQLTFSLIVTDSQGLSNSANVIITVQNVGNLSGYIDDSPVSVDFTALGVDNWSQWGVNAADTNQFLTRKAGVTDSIGPYLALDGTSFPENANSFDDDGTAFNWSGDSGDPVPNGTDETAGVYLTNTSLLNVPTDADGYPGIRLTVPADTSEKTVKVYLAVQSGTATFRAFLSDDSDPGTNDGSALSFEEDIEANSGTKFQVVTLNFGAESDTGKLLTIEYVLKSVVGSGNITLQAITLEAARVATLTINLPGGTITDTTPIVLETATPKAAIKYTADASDPKNSSSSMVYTAPFITLDSNATVQTVRAIAILPGFVDSDEISAQFLVNSSLGASLYGSVSDSPVSVDFTALGVDNWSQWGVNAADTNQFLTRKAGVTDSIGPYLALDGTSFPENANSFDDDGTAFNWSGDSGDPVPNGTDETAGVYLTNTSLLNVPTDADGYPGIRLTVPADTSEKTVKVYLAVQSGTATFRAFLSDDSDPGTNDGSALSFEEDIEANSGTKFQVVTLNFGAVSDTGKLLTIEYVLKSVVGGNITLQAITLN